MCFLLMIINSDNILCSYDSMHYIQGLVTVRIASNYARFTMELCH